MSSFFLILGFFFGLIPRESQRCSSFGESIPSPWVGGGILSHWEYVWGCRPLPVVGARASGPCPHFAVARTGLEPRSASQLSPLGRRSPKQM